MKLTRKKLKEIIREELGAAKPGWTRRESAAGPWIDYGTGKEIDPEEHLGSPYENLVNDLSDLIKRSIEEDGMDPVEARRAAEEAMDIEIGLGEEEEPLRLSRPEVDPLRTDPEARRRRHGRTYPREKK